MHAMGSRIRCRAGSRGLRHPPELPGNLPAAVAGQAAARHQLWTSTAARAGRAARAYAVNALATFGAAVSRTSPLDTLQPPGDTGDWDEQRLAPPAETGLHVIDAEAHRLHTAAVGALLPRRGPPPRQRRPRHRYAIEPAARPDPPGHALCALADFLRRQVGGGELLRRLHPIEPAPDLGSR